MKFGRKLQADRYAGWRAYYLDYNSLKKHLKQSTSLGPWTEENELHFKTVLSEELEKVYRFQKDKTSELASRIRAAESQVKSLVTEYEDDAEDGENAADLDRDIEVGDEGSIAEEDEEDDLDAVDEKFRELEENVATLVADVHDLALYSKLNFTGFMKIVKKHDKQTGYSLKTNFLHDFLDKRPFYKYNWDAIIVKLSKLYDLVRTRGHPIQGDASAGGSQSAFVRQTTKYWVHSDNLVHLKLAILRQLPVLVFNPNKEYEAKDSAITSIYLDNRDLSLYLGRLEKTEGAEAIRLRWYGDTNVKQIFVERKTHREDWTGEKSVKARFPIKEEHVNAFLRGEMTMDAEFATLIARGKKTQQEVDGMCQLANEIQYSILTRKLEPVMRTFYNRTAFQLPGDARVRISLDTELTMVREDDWDGRNRRNHNWRRTDIGIDWPFETLAEEDKALFPYGVLEIKLQTQFGQEPPEWVQALIESHLVESVPKFSKFIHGCATLLQSRVDLVPFWLPQMDTDIRKPDRGALQINRPSGSGASSSNPTAAGSTPELSTPDVEVPEYHEPVSEGEDDDPMVEVAKHEDRYIGVTAAEAAEAISFRKRLLSKAELPDAANVPITTIKKQVQSQAHKLSIDPLATASAFDEAFGSKLAFNLESIANDAGKPPVELIHEMPSVGGHHIAIPVRIEPKVYFASERTFLHWLQFGVLIGGIATTLLNFTPLAGFKHLLCAGAFACVALMVIAYSAFIFVYRSVKLHAKSPHGWYYDPYGPSVLCAVLLAALIINIMVQL